MCYNSWRKVMMTIDCDEIIPVSLEKFKLVSRVYAENSLYITRLITSEKHGILTVKGTGGTTYSALDKMKTLEKYLRDLGSNMNFTKVGQYPVKVTFGD